MYIFERHLTTQYFEQYSTKDHDRFAVFSPRLPDNLLLLWSRENVIQVNKVNTKDGIIDTSHNYCVPINIRFISIKAIATI